MDNRRLGGIVAAASIAILSGVANASVVGRPVSLDITITQGADLVVQALSVPIPGFDALDGKNYIPIGDIGGGLSTIYLSVWMDDETAEESLISFYVRAGDPATAEVAGPLPLFDLSGSGMIDVSIENLQFEVGGLASNVNVAQFASPTGDHMYSMYMMNSSGWYYMLPEVETVLLPPKMTHQVPYADFRDVNVGEYLFTNGSGTSVDIAWENMFSPVDTTYAITQSDSPYANTTDTSGGAVFELGLGAYAWGNYIVPEPATLGMFLMGALACFRRRRR